MAKLKKIISRVNRILAISQNNHDESMESLRIMGKKMDIIQATLVTLIALTLVAIIVVASVR